MVLGVSGLSQPSFDAFLTVLHNNAGVNVAAFLLMDSQKDSTSPGHTKSALPAPCKLQFTYLVQLDCQANLQFNVHTAILLDPAKHEFDGAAV